jgi:hypothetical protein
MTVPLSPESMVTLPSAFDDQRLVDDDRAGIVCRVVA